MIGGNVNTTVTGAAVVLSHFTSIVQDHAIVTNPAELVLIAGADGLLFE